MLIDAPLDFVKRLHSKADLGLTQTQAACTDLDTFRAEALGMMPEPGEIATRYLKLPFKDGLCLIYSYHCAPISAESYEAQLCIKLETEECNSDGCGIVATAKVFVGSEITGQDITDSTDRLYSK